MSKYYFVLNGEVYKTTASKQYNSDDKTKKKRGRKLSLKTKISREFVGMKDENLRELYAIILDYKSKKKLALYDNIDLEKIFEEKNKKQ